MPRKPRFFIPGLAAHVVQRGNNRQAVFFEEADYKVYLSLLNEARDRFSCAIHAYVLMTNHVHLLSTPTEKTSVSKMMQYVGRHYVPYMNRKYARTGTLWEGRFKATIIETSTYLLSCYRYIELNPVRAGMVQHPGEYPWSSFRKNGLQLEDSLITEHCEYLNLGESRTKRANNYRLLFNQPIPDDELSTVRNHTQSGTPLGNSIFRKEIEAALAIKTGQPMRGRPKGTQKTES
jgi:REP-associated tyrosine transposase